MNFNRDKIIPRYTIIITLLGLLGVGVIAKAAYVMFVQRSFWTEVGKRLVSENVPIAPTRGNIISADGQLMASSLPEFKIYMDFRSNADSAHRVKDQARKDSLLDAKMDSICIGLSHIFPDKSSKEFRARIKEGQQKRSRHWLIYPRRASFTQYKEVRKLPIFCQSRNASGLHLDTFNMRKKPFGSLATRTLGDLFGRIDSAKNGLELSYDSLLRGIPGRSHRKKVRNRWIAITDQNPVDGYDLVTTIDVGMQDVAEKALVNKLKEINGNVGIAILLEAATGEVKAMVNMTKAGDGEYYEMKNNAVADLMEPGSTFKTASIMVAIDDGMIDTTDHVETGCGIYQMHGRPMKDHNWRRGGYQRLSVPEVLMFSSNVGVSRLIDEHYFDDPDRYVRGLYRVGIAQDLHLPFVGAGAPRVRHPKRNPKRQREWLNWSNTALAWMSIGYETQLPPINTVTFYNAIANNGKMVRPKFVRAVVENGEVVQEFPTEVIKEQICKPTTLAKMRAILRRVVRDGLGKKAGNKNFPVSGKTGTAQISQGAGGYRSGTTSYFISFCGFFPSDNPKYTCLVAIKKTGLPASGGGMCGPVFREISEAVMAKEVKFRKYAEAARDTIHNFAPGVKKGDISAATYVLNQLNLKHNLEKSKPSALPVWGTAQEEGKMVNFARATPNKGIMPDATGMGAKDAVYLLESLGLKVRLNGVGHVASQSLPFGHKIVKGETVSLTLKQGK